MVSYTQEGWVVAEYPFWNSYSNKKKKVAMLSTFFRLWYAVLDDEEFKKFEEAQFHFNFNVMKAILLASKKIGMASI